MAGGGRYSPGGGALAFSGIARGLGSSLILAFVLSTFLGVVFYFAPLSEKFISSLLMAINVLGVAYGGLVSAKLAQTHGWLNGGLTGALYVTAFWLLTSIGIVPVAAISTISLIQAILGGLLIGAVGGIVGITLSQ